MEEDKLAGRLSNLDEDMAAVQAVAINSYRPVTALACALLDKGVIDKRDLLKIVDTLMMVAASEGILTGVEINATELALGQFRKDLEKMRLEPGKVDEELEAIESLWARQVAQRNQSLDQKRDDKA